MPSLRRGERGVAGLACVEMGVAAGVELDVEGVGCEG